MSQQFVSYAMHELFNSILCNAVQLRELGMLPIIEGPWFAARSWALRSRIVMAYNLTV